MIKCEHLSKVHNRLAFDCGNEALNRFLQTLAIQHGKRGIARTHVLVESSRPEKILGFYSLASLHIDQSAFPIKGYPKDQPIPAILIGRLAVDKSVQGQGFSRYLLGHALHIIKKLAQDTGIACIVVDAKDTGLERFYEKMGFEKTSMPLRLIMAVSTLK